MALLLFAGLAFGQNTGSLNGTVILTGIIIDPAGAVIPNSQLRLMETAAGAGRAVITDERGVSVSALVDSTTSRDLKNASSGFRRSISRDRFETSSGLAVLSQPGH